MFKCTCACGYSDTIENMITTTESRKVVKVIDGETVIGYLYDRIFHCPNCGITIKKQGSIGFSLEDFDDSGEY